MKCTHYREETESYNDTRWDEFLEEHVIDSRYRQVQKCYLEDIDTHRMKCRLCGEIVYYSNLAQNFFEGKDCSKDTRSRLFH